MINIDFDRKDTVFIAPLGGLGEIGMNSMVLIYRKEALVIDCGIMFPDASNLGVDLIVPDFQFLREADVTIKGIVLTHGHEDHIGGTPFLLNEFGNCPVYGTPFTLALLEDRIRDRGNMANVQLHPILPPADFKVGSYFDLSSIQVTHSIVDSMGVLIKTPVGTIIHSGDFKMDRDPVDGKRIDEHALSKAGKDGVLLLMSDSTNVERAGWSKPESEVAVGIEELFQKTKTGKIIVAVFASNIHRIQQILDSASRANRKVAFVGRSLHGNTEIATRLGHLKLNTEHLIPANEVEDYPPERVVLIATGTQAEPRSALYRMSLNDHPEIKIHPGDLVIMSSRFIPGNERNISHLVNNLYRRGAEVIDGESGNVHASGHAHREELTQMMLWTQPKFFLPVHGEYRMLVKHHRLAAKVLPKTKAIVAENGDLLALTADSFVKVQRIPSGKVFLDEAAADMGEEMLRDRRQLANTGLVVVSLVVKSDEGKIIEGPHFSTRGISEEEIDLLALKDELISRFKDLSREARGDDIEVEEEFRRVTRRFFRRATGIKPVVIPLVYEI